MPDQVGNPEYHQRLNHLYRMIKNGWWIILLCAVAVFAAVFATLSVFESRFQSVALVQAWRVPETRAYVSPAELEIRVNSSDLMQQAKANFSAESDSETQGDLVSPIVRVSRVPSSAVFRFVATANSPEAARGILSEALAILIGSVRPNEFAVSAAGERASELEQRLAELRRLAEIQVSRHVSSADNSGMLNSLISEFRVANIRAIYSDIYQVSTLISEINQYSYIPRRDNITQAPTLATEPLPSRALSTSLLAGIFVLLLGLGICVLYAAVFHRPDENEAESNA